MPDAMEPTEHVRWLLCLQKRPTRHKEYQYFGLKACKQADGAKKAALPPGTCPPSEEGQKDNWSARCGNDSVGCAWLQSVAARLGDFIRVATKSFRTPINFTERQWTVVSAMELH